MEPSILTTKCNFEGCKFIKEFTFTSGTKVPLFDICTTGAFNQMVGFAKFINAKYGNVYYRGCNSLFDNILPSLMRRRAKGMPKDLTLTLKQIAEDKYISKSLKLRPTIIPKSPQDLFKNKHTEKLNKYVIESLLQHYCGQTRFLDVVDNHWIATWMGLYNFEMHGKHSKFCNCKKRTLPLNDLYEKATNNKSWGVFKTSKLTNDIYVYIYLLAMPHSAKLPEFGITETEEFVEVDLRKALPSIYLRPHAQHALVIRRNDKNNTQQEALYYDMSSQIVGILRVRIDKADEWLGDGTLMTKDNIFPSPSIDIGYYNLLTREDVFKNPFELVKYY